MGRERVLRGRVHEARKEAGVRRLWRWVSIGALFLWQLPQNLLGALVALLAGARRAKGFYEYGVDYGRDGSLWATYRASFGVSLGRFIVFGLKRRIPSTNDARHERGHQAQSRILGPLYLPVIGLPSALGNVWDRLFHRKWSAGRRREWYYGRPWEAWADRLGGARR